MTTRLGWFSAKKRSGTRAITNSGQLQNNCPLFVSQNQGNIMQSVINKNIVLFLSLLKRLKEGRVVLEYRSQALKWFQNMTLTTSPDSEVVTSVHS